MPGLRLPDREVADRGKAIYRNRLKELLEPTSRDKLVAIDVESEDYEVADETLDAMDRLLERHPEAQIWVERVGNSGAFKAVGFKVGHRISKREYFLGRARRIHDERHSEIAATCATVGPIRFIAIDVESDEFRIANSIPESLRLLRAAGFPSQVVVGVVDAPESFVCSQIFERTSRPLDWSKIRERGEQIYEEVIRPKFEHSHRHQFVAIDAESEDFEIAAEEVPAIEELLIRHPQAHPWVERLGHAAAIEFRSPRRVEVG